MCSRVSYERLTSTKSVDKYEDFTNWTLSEIRQRVELVQGFDRLCDDIMAKEKINISSFIFVVEHFTRLTNKHFTPLLPGFTCC